MFYIPLCDYSPINTIRKSIIDIYGVETEDNYNQLMKEDVFLLLDGFNEMKSEYNRNFFEELKELSAKKQVQILITSRNDVIDVETSNFTKLKFEPISDKEIENWLKKHSPNYKENTLSPELYNILRNPMLLKIYAISINESILISQTQKAELFKNPTTTGEIIWNFLEYQIIKTTNLGKEYEGFNRILFRHLLPYIAYQIESISL